MLSKGSVITEAQQMLGERYGPTMGPPRWSNECYATPHNFL